MFKVHPEWFEVPKPKSDKGQNAVDYSVNIILDDELSMTASITIQRSESKTINRFYNLFNNSGVTA